MIGRRPLLAGAAALAGLGAARAQQPGMPVIGFLHSQSPETFAHLAAAFHEGLNAAGYEEGRNVAVEYRWAEGRPDRLPELAADLVARGVTVIFTGGGPLTAGTAQAATRTIPVVFVTGGDVVASGLVASLNRPGGNLTGVTMLSQVLEQKRLELLHELLPGTGTIAVLLRPTGDVARTTREELEQAARILGLQLRFFTAADEAGIETAFAEMAEAGIEALFVGTDSFFNNRRDRIVALAARYRIPAIYEQREFVAAGGLMSYGISLVAAYRQAGIWTARVLGGENPAELPVFQGMAFEYVVNMRTAEALGLTVPQSLLFLATEFIE